MERAVEKLKRGKKRKRKEEELRTSEHHWLCKIGPAEAAEP
jgi:hypothetical protein